MKRKLLGILFIGLGAASIVAILYFLFFNNFFKKPQEPIIPSTEPTTNNQPNNQHNVINTGQNTNNNIKNIPEKPKKNINININEKKIIVNRQEEELKRLASSFTERFGSYSNQSNFANITDLKLFMSKEMKKWADKFVIENRGKIQSDIYYGITTKAISQAMQNYSEDSGLAKIKVSTVRRESTGSTTNSSSFYQSIIIDFIKEKGAWKVNKATWE